MKKALAALLLLAEPGWALAAEVTVLCPRDVQHVVAVAAVDFQRATRHPVWLSYGTTGTIFARALTEEADIVIGSADGVTELEAKAAVRSGTQPADAPRERRGAHAVQGGRDRAGRLTRRGLVDAAAVRLDTIADGWRKRYETEGVTDDEPALRLNRCMKRLGRRPSRVRPGAQRAANRSARKCVRSSASSSAR